MHSIFQTNFIGAQESVYGDSPAGKLERSNLVRDMLVPLQQGFDSYGQACLPIGIHHLPTNFASEQRIVGTLMSVSQSTAMGTPPARVPTTDCVQMNIIVEASLFEDASEYVKRDMEDIPVVFPAFRVEPFEVFDCDISIKSLGDFDYFSNHLTKVCPDEIPLVSANLPEGFLLANRLENCFPLHELLPPCPDMLPEISLIENLTIRGKHTHRIGLCVHINPEDVLPAGNLLLFAEVCNNLPIFGQPISLARPPSDNQGSESLVIPVLLNRNSHPPSGIQTKPDEEIRLRAERLAVSGNIELDGASFNPSSLASEYASLDIANRLAVEGGLTLAC